MPFRHDIALPLTSNWYESNLEIIQAKSVGEQATVQVLGVNVQYRQLRLSLKRVQESPKQAYHRAHNQSVVDVSIIELLARGVRVRVAPDGPDGWIPIHELSWLYCSEPALRLSEGQRAKAKIIDYNPAHDNLILSLKQVLPNRFEEYRTNVSVGDEVRGTVFCHVGGSAEISLGLPGELSCAGYIYKSEVSNIAFVKDADLPSFLPEGVSFPFAIKRFDERNRIVELSRKSFLRDVLRELRYGESYSARIVQQDPRGVVVYGERLEGRLTGARNAPAVGEEISVIVARLGSEPRELELHPAT